MKIGDLPGGLINITFGTCDCLYHWLTMGTANAVEFIVSTIALVQGQVPVVQGALLGSMLSSLLLALGLCFFSGGLRQKENECNEMVISGRALLIL